MTQDERNLYALAERLHMPVYRLRSEMPYSEYRGWIEYLREPEESKNLLNNPDALVAAVNAFHG